MLAPDVLRLVVSRVSLWEARCMHRAHPLLAALVREHVAILADRAVATPRLPMIDRFLRSAASEPGFGQLVHGRCTFRRTPYDATLDISSGGFTVRLWVSQRHPRARIEVTATPPVAAPGFGELLDVFTALWWFDGAVKALAVEDVKIVTRARTHHPVSEQLNVLATEFVESCIKAPA